MSQTTLHPSPGPADPGGHAGRRRPRRRLWALLAAAILVPLLVGGAGVWWFLLRGDAPASVDLSRALAGIETGSSPGGVEGTWMVDPSVVNADGTGSFAGFRIDEVLATIGATTAVGRSTAVQGTLTVTGTQDSRTTVTAAEVTVDLTAVTSDEPRRNSPIRRSLETNLYPDATFVLTDPIDVGSVPEDGRSFTLPATGDLTIHGVTRRVTLDLDAQLQGDVLVVVGSTPVALSDYGVTTPTAPIVASLADHATVELQLYLRHT